MRGLLKCGSRADWGAAVRGAHEAGAASTIDDAARSGDPKNDSMRMVLNEITYEPLDALHVRRRVTD